MKIKKLLMSFLITGLFVSGCTSSNGDNNEEDTTVKEKGIDNKKMKLKNLKNFLLF